MPLAWAVKALPELPFPEAICDVRGLARTLLALDARALGDDRRAREQDRAAHGIEAGVVRASDVTPRS